VGSCSGLDSSGSEYGPVAGSCEHINGLETEFVEKGILVVNQTV